ncbi:helix-turn-helix transcriptional regulator [Paracoccus suum]|uniref:helix-turn-helix transcriptional regulator n=1 Tax=Paracoccus suum TaxID=2259340 RepID=UPI0013B05A73|nr:hypothetical protein [Paracoccus suum]
METVSSSNLINAKSAAARLGVTAWWLANDRMIAGQSGTQPKVPFVRLGERMIRYRAADIDAYIVNNLIGPEVQK